MCVPNYPQQKASAFHYLYIQECDHRSNGQSLKLINETYNYDHIFNRVQIHSYILETSCGCNVQVLQSLNTWHAINESHSVYIQALLAPISLVGY